MRVTRVMQAPSVADLPSDLLSLAAVAAERRLRHGGRRHPGVFAGTGDEHNANGTGYR